MTASPEDLSPTVLYVEDSVPNQELMRRVISKRPGVSLLVAGTGAGALEAALAASPALILMDYHLPDMSAEEILEMLRARDETRDMPVIIVSGTQDVSLVGADDDAVIGHLRKPYDVLELLSFIDRVLAT